MDQRARVLIVDDTPLNVRVLAEVLKGEHTVLAASNGQKALELCARDPQPDLVLLDVMMPEMDGYEVLRRLQSDPQTAHLPVVFVTALNEEQNEHEGLSLGAVDYIAKPFNPTLVKARVRNHLELKRHRDQLEAEVKRRTEQLLEARQTQARLEAELSTARRLQLSMLPSRTKEMGGRGSLSAFLNPARVVGGDLFDYVLTEDGKALLMLGDVSDKGISAALFMVKTLTLLRAFSQSETHPSKLLEVVNNALCQNNDESMFVTLVCGLLDFSTGEFCWASGGHEPPLKFGEGDCEFLAQETGPALGLMEDATYPLHSFRLSPGEGVVLYSDGITEAQGVDEVEFGMERFKTAVLELGQVTPQSVCDQLLDKIGLFVDGAEQFDDMVVMAVNWNGPALNRVFLSPNTQQGVIKTLENMLEHFRSCGVDPELTHDIQLVSEELLVNTVIHGYEEDTRDEITVSTSKQGEKILLEFRDRAKAFNPLEAEERDLEEERAGGWGIPLLKELTDEISYCHENNTNILSIKFNGKK